MYDNYIKGQWDAFDKIISLLNSIDTEAKTGLEVRKEIYHLVMDLRPKRRI